MNKKDKQEIKQFINDSRKLTNSGSLAQFYFFLEMLAVTWFAILSTSTLVSNPHKTLMFCVTILFMGVMFFCAMHESKRHNKIFDSLQSQFHEGDGGSKGD